MKKFSVFIALTALLSLGSFEPASAASVGVTGNGIVRCVGGTLSNHTFVTPLVPLAIAKSTGMITETREVILVENKSKDIWSVKAQRTTRITKTAQKVMSKSTTYFYPTLSAICNTFTPSPVPSTPQTPAPQPSVSPTPSASATPNLSSPSSSPTPSPVESLVLPVSPTPTSSPTPTNTIPPTAKGTTIKVQGWGRVACPVGWVIGPKTVLSFKMNSIPPKPGNTGYFDTEYINSTVNNVWTLTWKRTTMTSYLSGTKAPKISSYDFGPLIEATCIKS